MAFADIGPAQRAVEVTPSDTTLVNARALWIGGTGNLAVQFAGDVNNGDDTAKTLVGIPAGTLLPIAVARVMAATTCTNIVGLK